MPITGHKQTEEHKAAISKALKARYEKCGPSHGKPCYIMETGQQFRSQRECANYLGLNESTIVEAIKFNYNTKGGHIASGWLQMSIPTNNGNN